MLDIKLIRQNPDFVRDSLFKRGADAAAIDDILRLDEQRRKLLQETEALRAAQNRLSKLFGKAKLFLDKGDESEKSWTPILEQADQEFGYSSQLREEAKLKGSYITSIFPEEIHTEFMPRLRLHGESLAVKRQELKNQFTYINEKLQNLLLLVPNIVHPSVPPGEDESKNVVVRHWGQPKEFSFKPLPHWELGERLGIIDFDRGAKLSGSRFYVLKGLGSRLERALIDFMIDLHTGEHGYTEVATPYLVRRQVMEGTGQLPKFEEELYRCDLDDLFLIPTAEVTLVNLHRDEVLEPGALPLYYTGYTACFRREAGAAGRDTRGVTRVHQFDKVELVKFTEPDASYEELDKLVADAEDVLHRLEIPHRVTMLCSGDLGFASTKTYDIDAWCPGQDKYVEVSSCSNCESFQARRANIRYRPAPKAKPEFVHTLNGSGIAVGRTFAAVLENYQQPDGSVTVPQVLRPYMGGLELIR